MFLTHLKEITQSVEAQNNDPYLILAAKLTEIFFYRIIREKNRNHSNTRADAALNELVQRLLQYKTVVCLYIFCFFVKFLFIFSFLK